MGRWLVSARALAVVLVVVTVAAVAAVPAALARPGTTAPSVYVNIHVTLSDTKVIVSPKTAPRGSEARLIVRNIGTKPHNFTLVFGAGRGFTRVFKPKQHQILLLYLALRGVMTYYSGTTAAQAGPGMKGVFVVGATCNFCVPD